LPEGHTIHRAARDHHRIFARQKLIVSSPQGRFSEGASILNEQICSAVEAFGKHLLYKFNNEYTLHIHLGLFGRIRKQKLPFAEPKSSVRIRLMGKKYLVDIIGPTICEALDQKGVMDLIRRIGPDVLRPDANPDFAFEKISRSKAPIGRLIMDQSVMAGIGNIYRSEILWRQAIHPETPGKAICQRAFDRIWGDARALLAIGVKRNAIVTVFDEQSAKRGYGEKYNIFGKTNCPNCKGEIRRFEISGRRTFVCETCQPIET
jgi:endonuclease-8